MIDQAHRDSKKSSREFLLFIGQDRREPIAITNAKDLPFGKNYLKGTINKIEVSMFKLADLLLIDDAYFFLKQ